MNECDMDFVADVPEGHDVEEVFDYLANKLSLDDSDADLTFSANGRDRTVTIHIWRGGE
jgi:hypothetical protein